MEINGSRFQIHSNRMAATLAEAALRPLFLALKDDLRAQYNCDSTLQRCSAETICWKITGDDVNLSLTINGRLLPGSATGIISTDSSVLLNGILSQTESLNINELKNPFDIYDDLCYELEVQLPETSYKTTFFSLSCLQMHIPKIIQLALKEIKNQEKTKGTSQESQLQTVGTMSEIPQDSIESSCSENTEETSNQKGRTRTSKIASKIKLRHLSKSRNLASSISQSEQQQQESQTDSTMKEELKNTSEFVNYLESYHKCTQILASSFYSTVSSIGCELDFKNSTNSFEFESVTKHQLLLGVCSVAKEVIPEVSNESENKNENENNKDAQLRVFNSQMLLEGIFTPFEAIVRFQGIVILHRIIWNSKDSNEVLSLLNKKINEADNYKDRMNIIRIQNYMYRAYKTICLSDKVSDKYYTPFFEAIRISVNFFTILKILNTIAYDLFSRELAFGDKEPSISYMLSKDFNSPRACVLSSITYNKRVLARDLNNPFNAPIPINTFHMSFIKNSYSIDLSLGGSKGSVFFNLLDNSFIKEYTILRSYITRVLIEVDKNIIKSPLSYVKEPTVVLRKTQCLDVLTSNRVQISWTDIYSAKIASEIMKSVAKMVICNISSIRQQKREEIVDYSKELKAEYCNLKIPELEWIDPIVDISENNSLDMYLILEIFKLKLKLIYINNPVVSVNSSSGTGYGNTNISFSSNNSSASSSSNLNDKNAQNEKQRLMNNSCVPNIFIIEINDKRIAAFPIVFINSSVTNITENIARSCFWKNIPESLKISPLEMPFGSVLEFLLVVRLFICLKDIKKYYKNQQKFSSLVSGLSYDTQYIQEQISNTFGYRLVIFKSKDPKASCTIEAIIGNRGVDPFLSTIGGKNNVSQTEEVIKKCKNYANYMPTIRYSMSQNFNLESDDLFKEMINDFKKDFTQLISVVTKIENDKKTDLKHFACSKERDQEMRPALFQYIKDTNAVIFDRLAYTDSFRNILTILSTEINLGPLLNVSDPLQRFRGNMKHQNFDIRGLKYSQYSRDKQTIIMEAFYRELLAYLGNEYIIKYIEVSKCVERIDVSYYVDTMISGISYENNKIGNYSNIQVISIIHNDNNIMILYNGKEFISKAELVCRDTICNSNSLKDEITGKIVVSIQLIIHLLNIKNKIRALDNQISKLSEITGKNISLEENIEFNNPEKPLKDEYNTEKHSHVTLPTIVVNIHPINYAGIDCFITTQIECELSEEKKYYDVYKTTSEVTIKTNEIHPAFFDTIKLAEKITSEQLLNSREFQFSSESMVDKREDIILNIVKKYEKQLQYIIIYNISQLVSGKQVQFREMRIGKPTYSKYIILRYDQKEFMISYCNIIFKCSSLFEFQTQFASVIEQYLLITKLSYFEEEVLQEFNKRYSLSLNCKISCSQERNYDESSNQRKKSDKAVTIKVLNGTFTLLVIYINIYGSTEIKTKQDNTITRQLRSKIEKFMNL